MQVLEVAPPWFPVPPQSYGGIEEVVALLADGLTERGHAVTLAASGGSRTKAKLRAPFPNPPTEAIGDLWHEAIHVLEAYLRHAGDADVIHDHTSTIGPAIGAVIQEVPVVHTLHGPWTPQIERLHNLLAGRLALVAISHDQAARAPSGIEVRAVIPNAVDVEQFTPRLERRGGGYLVFVGRANHEKGPEVAVRIAKRLRVPLKMVVKVVEPTEREYWRDVVEPEMDGADVERVEGIDRAEQAKLVAAADATLCPVQWPEPFGLVAIESMACGTPVVAYGRGALPETVVHGETGFVAAPDDIDAMCDFVRQIREIDPCACRDHVAQRYAAHVMVDRYETLFHEVADKPSAP